MPDQSLPRPFLDWYGIWASHRKLEADGTVWSQDPPRGVSLTIEPARKSDVFLTQERPWERQANLGVSTVLYESGRYRLWYGAGKVDGSVSLVCYAESEDGFDWDRPDLGLVEYEGSAHNNILYEGQAHHVDAVFADPVAPSHERYKGVAARGVYYRDGRPDPALDKERYKELLIAMDLGGLPPEERARKLEVRQQLRASVSPDGIRWTNLEDPILDAGSTALDTHNLCNFDPHQGKYVAYLRGHLERRRLVRRAEGVDFRCLGPPRACLMCDPQDPIDDDIYNPCYCPYPGRPLYLMFPSVYHRIESTVDIQLATSHDSYTWSRPERRPIIDRTCGSREYGTLYASPNLVALASGEWRLPFAGHFHRHDFRERGARYPADGELRWACWQQDRLVGLEAVAEGCVTLVQRVCAGEQLRLNYRTAGDGWVKAELVRAPDTPPKPVRAYERYSLAEAENLNGDERSRVVCWQGNSDLSSLKGKEVAVRLHLCRAKVFSTAL